MSSLGKKILCPTAPSKRKAEGQLAGSGRAGAGCALSLSLSLCVCVFLFFRVSVLLCHHSSPFFSGQSAFVSSLLSWTLYFWKDREDHFNGVNENRCFHGVFLSRCPELSSNNHKIRASRSSNQNHRGRTCPLLLWFPGAEFLFVPSAQAVSFRPPPSPGRSCPSLFKRKLGEPMFEFAQQKHLKNTWVWLKIKQEGLRRFWSMFPLTRVPFWYCFFFPRATATCFTQNTRPQAT